jgi:LysM repeat protein
MTRVFFKFLTIFSFCIFYGNAQNLTKNHTVKKGETVYRLSKMYNVSISQIIQLNPSASKVIYINEVLKIPVSRVNSDESKTSSEKNSTKINDLLAYKVKSGDTKFGLSKKFGISITNLENQNSHIKKGLQAGHILKISNSNYSPPSQSTATNNPQQSESRQFHKVIKGDTFFSISKLYTVDLALLISTNSSIIPKKMSIGTQIRIPNQALNSNTSLQNRTEYLVKKGDTKFGLAKIFNTTIEQLETLNPQISDMLRSGVTIKIPSKLSNEVAKSNGDKNVDKDAKIQTSNDTIINSVPPKTVKDSINEKPETKITTRNTISNETELTVNTKDSSAVNTISTIENQNNELDYKNYVIEPKETLYGLSKKAGLSIPEFLKLNPNLSESVLVGTIIKMPITNSDSNLKTNIQNPNTDIDTDRDSYTDLSTLITSTKNKKILMLMPFSEIEFNYYTKSTANYDAISNTDLQNNIQFYKGTKTAIDSLNNLGIKTEINLLKVDDITITKALENIDLDSYDAIITLNYNQNIEKAFLSKTTADIPIITLNSKLETYTSSSIFQALPSVYIQKLKTLQYVNSKEGNIIVISDKERIDSRSFITKHSPATKMVITNNKDEYSSRDIVSKLDKNKTNYIIIDSKKNGIFLSSTTLLLGQTSNYDIQLVVLESSLLPNNQQISSKRFRILKLIYPDINQITNTIQTLKYFNNYKLKYDIEPSQNILHGFDITFDTALRLSQDMEFKDSAITYKTSYLTLKFNYVKNTFTIYDNNEIIIREFND